MPLYNYKCKCGSEFEAYMCMEERHSCPCPSCGDEAAQTLSAPSLRKACRISGWYEHIEKAPVYVKDKKHLRELCNKNDCYAMVLDG